MIPSSARLLIAAGMIATLGALAGCARPTAAIIGVDGASRTAAEVEGTKPVEIFVATSRQIADEEALLFDGERNDEVTFARVTVWLPPNHQPGEIERAATMPPDPRRHFVVTDPAIFADEAEFAASINADLSRKRPQHRDILLFVHGYNTDFATSVLRLAQFVEDSGYRGTPVVFTWASRALTTSYIYDINSALHARDSLVETGDVLADTMADEIDIVAHSMGSLLTVEAVRQQAHTGREDITSRINALVIAAPDIDVDVFRRQLQAIPPDTPPIYVFTSGDDKPLKFSRLFAGSIDRVGNSDPDELAELGVTVLDLTAIDDTGKQNHSKFASSPEVVRLIGTSILRLGGLFDDDDTAIGSRPPTEAEVGPAIRVATGAPQP